MGMINRTIKNSSGGKTRPTAFNLLRRSERWRPTFSGVPSAVRRGALLEALLAIIKKLFLSYFGLKKPGCHQGDTPKSSTIQLIRADWLIDPSTL
jgi:hypothetical protein